MIDQQSSGKTSGRGTPSFFNLPFHSSNLTLPTNYDSTRFPRKVDTVRDQQESEEAWWMRLETLSQVRA